MKRGRNKKEIRENGGMDDAQMKYTGTELEAMEWARNYHRWILEMFRPHVRGTVIEIGAGIGTFSELLAACEPEELRCYEPAANLFPQLQRRMSGRPRVKLENASYNGDASGDAVVLVNVLEHIEDDRRMLERIRAALRPGGRLLVFVPALPMLYGTLDEQFGHYRRYTRAQLRELAKAAGYEIEMLRYANFPGVFAWFLTAKILRRRTVSPAAAAFYDKSIVPLVRFVESKIAPPMGQSLVLIAKV